MTGPQLPSCRLCGAHELPDVLDLGMQPISNRFRARLDEAESLFSLRVVRCSSCGLTQLCDPPAPEELAPRFDWLTYNEPEGHLDQLAKQIIELFPSGERPLAWGLSFKDDTLLKRLELAGVRTHRLDPAMDLGIMHPGAGVESIQARLKPSVLPSLIAAHGRPNLIIARHIVEHVHELRVFLRTMTSALSPGGFLVVEIPDCEPSFRHLDYTIIWEEHVSYHTMRTLNGLFAVAGMKPLFREVLPLGHESLLIGIGQAGVMTDKALPSLEASSNEATIAAFGNRFGATRERFAGALSQARQRGDRVAILRAGHLACAFVNFLQLAEFVDIVVDDNPKKQGMYLPGTPLRIFGSEALREMQIRLCLLSVGPEAESKVVLRNNNFTDAGGRFASIFTASKMSLI